MIARRTCVSLAEPLEQVKLEVFHQIPVLEKNNQKMRVRSGEQVARETGNPSLDIVGEGSSVKACSKTSNEILQSADFSEVSFLIAVGDEDVRLDRGNVSVRLKLVDIIEVERIGATVIIGGVDTGNGENSVGLKE